MTTGKYFTKKDLATNLDLVCILIKMIKVFCGCLCSVDFDIPVAKCHK